MATIFAERYNIMYARMMLWIIQIVKDGTFPNPELIPLHPNVFYDYSNILYFKRLV